MKTSLGSTGAWKVLRSATSRKKGERQWSMCGVALECSSSVFIRRPRRAWWLFNSADSGHTVIRASSAFARVLLNGWLCMPPFMVEADQFELARCNGALEERERWEAKLRELVEWLEARALAEGISPRGWATGEVLVKLRELGVKP